MLDYKVSQYTLNLNDLYLHSTFVIKRNLHLREGNQSVTDTGSDLADTFEIGG
jgi:hypothetical protein